MRNWKETIERTIEIQPNKVVRLDLLNRLLEYDKRILSSRNIQKITGDEEIVRASLVNRLINELDYRAESIVLEKEYSVKYGHKKGTPRIDLIVKDENANPYFFIEIKAPDKFESDKNDIDGQLFTLAQVEERDFNTKVSYLVYYTVDFIDDSVADRSIIIDFEKYKTYSDWVNSGYASVGNEIVAGYGEPKKQPLVKGSEKNDLRVRIDRREMEGLSRNLHNVLWGGGGTTDSEIFYSLVNIILAKIQDESEKEDGEEYDFQVYMYGDNIENASKVYDRVNSLYKRALKEQLNVYEQHRIDDDSVINRNKFPLNKLVYTVQVLESFSFLEGRSSLDGKDILGDFFETITRDGFKQNKGQFFTPTNIVDFLLYALKLDELSIDKLNNSRELPFIIDPSAGSGTYLVESMKLITKEVKYKQKSKIKSSRQIEKRYEELFIPDHNENKWAREYLYGTEINFDLGTASKVNMILHGDGSTNIFVKDGLLPFELYKKEVGKNILEFSELDELYSGKQVNGKFDVVVSNPPFSVDLDKQTQKEVKNSFLFGDKKNSENLFIERYYQLLKEGGRLGVVLPESIFDTSENKYIRLFIFKYFNIKAVVSIPQLTFEPYTSTKTSILFAQKKTQNEVERWCQAWDRCGKEWSLLKTRIKDYIDYFVLGNTLNNKWAKDVVEDIKFNNLDNIRKNIYKFLKNYIAEDESCLDIKYLLEKYSNEIEKTCKIEKEVEVFGHYNSWWVFNTIINEKRSDESLDYNIFMAEATNIGYKRTKRGEKNMPNDLFDLEYAPETLDIDTLLEKYKNNKNELIENKMELLEKLTVSKSTDKSKMINNKIEKIDLDIKELDKEEKIVTEVLTKYYETGVLKEEYHDRIDVELVNIFKEGYLKAYACKDILLRSSETITILDAMRKEIKWD